MAGLVFGGGSLIELSGVLTFQMCGAFTINASGETPAVAGFSAQKLQCPYRSYKLLLAAEEVQLKDKDGPANWPTFIGFVSAAAEQSSDHVTLYHSMSVWRIINGDRIPFCFLFSGSTTPFSVSSFSILLLV
jgi:hypothetical protein